MQAGLRFQEPERRVTRDGRDEAIRPCGVLLDDLQRHAALAGPLAVHRAQPGCKAVRAVAVGEGVPGAAHQEKGVLGVSLGESLHRCVDEIKLLRQPSHQVGSVTLAVPGFATEQASQQRAGCFQTRLDPVAVLCLSEDGEALCGVPERGRGHGLECRALACLPRLTVDGREKLLVQPGQERYLRRLAAGIQRESLRP